MTPTVEAMHRMYRIISKEALSDTVKLMTIEAPHVARRAQAGQFVIIRIDEFGERVPLTIADFDRLKGTITIIFQELGKSTMQLGSLNEGDSIASFAGPLGHPSDIRNYGTVVCVGGGAGIAPIYPIARSLKEAGNRVISVIGARTKGLIFWEDRMSQVSDALITCTDDGSYGRKSVVTGPLNELLGDKSENISHVWAIGPSVMMKSVAEATRMYKVPTTVSLNTIMIDGTGMCGGCRVLLEDGAQFVCVDGPEFDAHKVDWESLLFRLKFYRDEEKKALENYDHKCNLDKALDEGAE